LFLFVFLKKKRIFQKKRKKLLELFYEIFRYYQLKEKKKERNSFFLKLGLKR